MEPAYHRGVLLLVGGRHDFDAAVGCYDKLLFGERDGFARSGRLLGLGLLDDSV